MKISKEMIAVGIVAILGVGMAIAPTGCFMFGGDENTTLETMEQAQYDALSVTVESLTQIAASQVIKDDVDNITELRGFMEVVDIVAETSINNPDAGFDVITYFEPVIHEKLGADAPAAIAILRILDAQIKANGGFNFLPAGELFVLSDRTKGLLLAARKGVEQAVLYAETETRMRNEGNN